MPEEKADTEVAHLVLRMAAEQRDWYAFKVWYCLFFWHCVTFWSDLMPGLPLGKAASSPALQALHAIEGRTEAFAATRQYDVTDGLTHDAIDLDAYEAHYLGFGAFARWWFEPIPAGQARKDPS